MRPDSLADDYCRLRSSKSSWFSYYQQEGDEDCQTEESHLPLTPMEDRVLSPCSDLELDSGTLHTVTLSHCHTVTPSNNNNMVRLIREREKKTLY